MPITLNQFIEESGLEPTLVRAVVRQLGGWQEAKQSMIDIASHGINGGFHGFIYYPNTVAFFKRHRATICELVNSTADDFGESPITMITSFNYLKNVETQDSILRCLGGGPLRPDPSNDTLVANALTWFAAEEVARRYSDLIETS